MPATAKRVVIAEAFAESGQQLLRSAGIEVVSCVGAERRSLLEAIRDAQGLIVRSETRVDRELLSAGEQLCVVGRAGVGVDAIDVAAATQAGIVVVNTPAANTIAATEQTFALMLSLLRNVPAANASVRAGQWKRTPFIGHELYGKTLGVIGLGRIGSGVASRAKAFGARVLAADPFIAASRAEAVGAELREVRDLLAQSDIITLHVPLNEQTIGMIGAPELDVMKKDAVLINCARGGVIVERALLQALEAGKFRGVALDVFAQEPPAPQSAATALQNHPRVLSTPHLGGSTHEALARIAIELANDVVNVLCGRPAGGVVNAPAPSGADAAKIRPYVELAYRIGLLLPQLQEQQPLSSLSLLLRGDVAGIDATPITTALLSGLLQRTTDIRISVVNADVVARERGISVEVQHQTQRDPWASAIEVRGGGHHVAATALDHGLRFVELDGFEIDAAPSGVLIITHHQDIPGMIGRTGTVLGDAQVNISTMQVARQVEGGEAMMVLSVDRTPDEKSLDALRAIPGMRSVGVAHLP